VVAQACRLRGGLPSRLQTVAESSSEPRPSRERSDTLLRDRSLPPHVEQHHQVHPQTIQEVPEDGADIDDGAPGRPLTRAQRLDGDIDERRHASHQVEKREEAVRM